MCIMQKKWIFYLPWMFGFRYFCDLTNSSSCLFWNAFSLHNDVVQVMPFFSWCYYLIEGTENSSWFFENKNFFVLNRMKLCYNWQNIAQITAFFLEMGHIIRGICCYWWKEILRSYCSLMYDCWNVFAYKSHFGARNLCFKIPTGEQVQF